MEELALEIYEKIFRYFLNVSLINLSRTNKFFYSLVKDYIKLKKINLKCKSFRFPLQINFDKWSKIIKIEDSFAMVNKNQITDFYPLDLYDFGGEKFTNVEYYRGYFFTSKYDSCITVTDKNLNTVLKIGPLNEAGSTVVGFEIRGDKIYFCSSFNQVSIYSLNGDLIKEFKTKYCSSFLKLSDDGKIIYVAFSKQNSVIAYENGNEYKELKTFYFKKFGKVKVLATKGPMFFVGLENGNVNVFKNLEYCYYVKTNFEKIDQILPVGMCFYAINYSSHKVKFCECKKIVNIINFKDLGVISKRFTLDNQGNLVMVYSMKNLPIGFD